MGDEKGGQMHACLCQVVDVLSTLCSVLGFFFFSRHDDSDAKIYMSMWGFLCIYLLVMKGGDVCIKGLTWTWLSVIMCGNSARVECDLMLELGSMEIMSEGFRSSVEYRACQLGI